MNTQKMANHQAADQGPDESEIIRISRVDLKKNYKNPLPIKPEPNDPDYDQLPTELENAAIILIDRMWREKSYMIEAGAVS
jgi:hypothetical protein